MKIDGILYCFDDQECIMGWNECNINFCPFYKDYNKIQEEQKEE